MCDDGFPLRRESSVAPEILAKPFCYLLHHRRPATDTDIWNYARQHELVIVSKDTDFSNRIIVSQPPPWVVHLRFGNLRRREFHALLAQVWPQIEQLLKSHKLVC